MLLASVSYASFGWIRDVVVVLKVYYTVLKKEVGFKCWICTSQETETAVERLDIKFDGQSLEIVEKFCYFGGTIRARRGCN